MCVPCLEVVVELAAGGVQVLVPIREHVPAPDHRHTQLNRRDIYFDLAHNIFPKNIHRRAGGTLSGFMVNKEVRLRHLTQFFLFPRAFKFSLSIISTFISPLTFRLDGFLSGVEVGLGEAGAREQVELLGDFKLARWGSEPSQSPPSGQPAESRLPSRILKVNIKLFNLV